MVIGGGPAGVFAAIEAKRRDPQAAVTLISDEPCEPYERPPLSKAVLLGTASAADAPIAGPKGLAGHGVRLECNTRCTAIDRAAQYIVTASGGRLAYDALVIATGSVVRQIPVLPLGVPHVHDEPAVGRRREAGAGVLETSLGHASTLILQLNVNDEGDSVPERAAVRARGNARTPPETSCSSGAPRPVSA